MDQDPRLGERVEHFQHGSGIVMERLAFGRLRVRFDRTPTLPRTIDRDELLAAPLPARLPEAELAGKRGLGLNRGGLKLSPALTTPPPKPAPLAPAPKMAPEALAASALPKLTLSAPTAWQTLEALRLGVVPTRGTSDYTVGRQAELEQFGQLLKIGQGCRFLWGDYGSGKTHLLETLEQVGLEANFAVARLTLDPREQALHHPLRIYQQIARSLRLPGRPVSGLSALLEALLNSPEHKQPTGKHASRFLSPCLHALAYGGEEQVELFTSYARGDDVDIAELNAALARTGWTGERLLTLSDYRTYGRMYAHLVGTLAAWSKDAGQRGLLLLFDEVERMEALTQEDRRFAREVLQHYAAIALPAEQLSFDPEKLYKGGQPVHQALPIRFRPDQPLCAVFAVTPLEETEAFVRQVSALPELHLRLSTLHANLRGELVARIVRLYQRAYPGFVPPEGLSEQLVQHLGNLVGEGQDSQRAAVRLLVFGLDQARLSQAQSSAARP
jgi:hypothetical protein